MTVRFTQNLNLSVLVCCFCRSKKGGASRSRVREVGACKAQRTAGSPASAVLQSDAMPVGLDAEADRCHLKGNQITCGGVHDAAGSVDDPGGYTF